MPCTYNCSTRDAVSAVRAGQDRGSPPLAPRTPMMAPSGQRGWNPGRRLPPCCGGQLQDGHVAQQGWTPTKPMQGVGQQNQSLGFTRCNSPAATTSYESLDSGYLSASYTPNRGAAWCPHTTTAPSSSAATCVAAYSTPPQTPYSRPPPAYPSPRPSYPSPPPSYRSPPLSYRSSPSPYSSPVGRALPYSPGYGAFQPSARTAPYGNFAAAGARMPVNAWGAPGGICNAGSATQGVPSALRSPARALHPVPCAQQHPTPQRAEEVSFAEYFEEPYLPSFPQRDQAAQEPQMCAKPSHRVAHLSEGPEGAINLEVTLLSPDSFATDSFTSDSLCPDSFTEESLGTDSFTSDPSCPHAVCTVTFTPEPVAQDSFGPSVPSAEVKEDEATFLVSLKQRAELDAAPATATPPCTPTNVAVCPGERYAAPAPAQCPDTKPAGTRRGEEVPLEVRALFSGVADVLAQPDAGAAYRQPVRLRGVVTPAQPPRTAEKSNMPDQASTQMPNTVKQPPESIDSEISPKQDVAAESPTSSPVPPPPPPGPGGEKKCICATGTKPPEAAAPSRGGHLTCIRRLDTPAGPVWSATVSADGGVYDVMATLAAGQPAGAA